MPLDGLDEDGRVALSSEATDGGASNGAPVSEHGV